MYVNLIIFKKYFEFLVLNYICVPFYIRVKLPLSLTLVKSIQTNFKSEFVSNCEFIPRIRKLMFTYLKHELSFGRYIPPTTVESFTKT